MRQMPSVRHSESRSFSLLLLSLCVLSSLVHDALAVGVTFTTPAAGATWPAGPITVRWTDAGGSPDMAALDTYELQLIVGGNDPLNSKPIATIGSPGGKVSTGQITGTIDPEIAQSFENGFYFRMISNTTDGNTVINYSNRFTLINMKGTTDSAYLDGANAARGSGNVPAAQYNIVAQPTNTAIASSSATPTTTVLPTATATATETSTPSDDGPGLGMMIGIGVGSFLALVGVVSLFVWAFMLYRHKKKRKEQQRLKNNNNDLDRPRGVSQFGKAELPARNSLATPQSAYPTELSPIGAKYELEGDGRAVEAARASIYELDSGWDGWEAMSGRKSKAYDPTNVV